MNNAPKLLFGLLFISYSLAGSQLAQTQLAAAPDTRVARLLEIDSAMDTISSEVPTVTPEVAPPAINASPAIPNLFTAATIAATTSQYPSAKSILKPLLHLRAQQRASPLQKPTCSKCGRIFTQKHSLDDHMRTHTGEKPFACTFEGCNKTFSSPAGLRNHKKVHTKPTSFACRCCIQKFTSQALLNAHMREEHPKEPLYQCQTCGRGFPKKAPLTVHLRTHTGEKPYECLSCHKRFASYGNFATHTRTHTGEKPYVCLHCNKGFTTPTNLKTHLNTQHT